MRLTDYDTAHEAIVGLCEEFLDIDALLADSRCVDPAETPAPYRELLVHNEHMTTKLAAFHGAAVELRVLGERLGAGSYNREIALALPGGDVVEFGAVRVRFQHVPDDVRAEILARQTPLGDILIRHDVLRRIEPRWFVRFGPGSSVLGYFAAGTGEAYGRIGTIYCDGEPAIELLEVVVAP